MEASLTKQIVEFEFSIGDKVIVPGLNDAVGYVLSLWYSDRGPRYEVAYYCDGKREVVYFLAIELTEVAGKKTIGYGGKG
jgi:hypothetical protein